MITAAAVTPTTGGPATSGPAIGESSVFSQPADSGLGQDAFLRLLITQIQMQDPLEPLSATEYVAQLAQFSAVEQLQSANLHLEILYQAQAVCQALVLIGRNVSTADDAVTGIVDAVVFSDGQLKLLVGDQEVDPGDIVRVW